MTYVTTTVRAGVEPTLVDNHARSFFPWDLFFDEAPNIVESSNPKIKAFHDDQFRQIGPRDVLGKTIYELAHPRDHKKIRHFLSRR